MRTFVMMLLGISKLHTMTKAETHLIEISNSSIRDNLACFNRKTKRFSKSYSALNHNLKLFIHKGFFESNKLLTQLRYRQLFL
jgi:insertion element IS1 protein InsB